MTEKILWEERRALRLQDRAPTSKIQTQILETLSAQGVFLDSQGQGHVTRVEGEVIVLARLKL